MVERLGGQHLEAQVQHPFDSAIARFCGGFGSINTRRAYGGDLRDFSRFATGLGVGELGQLTVGHIEEYLQNCTEKGLSGATIRVRIASLSGLLTQEGLEELANKTRDISNKHIGSKPEMQPFHPLSNKEIKRLQEVSRDNPRASAIIAIALGTGANVSEILALHANNIVEADGQVSIGFGEEHGRIAKLSPEASATIKRHKGDRRGKLPLFAREKLSKKEIKPLNRTWLWKVLKKYGESIGRPDLNQRVLRQTFIMNVQVKDSKELAKLLGVGGDYAYDVLLERRRLTQLLPQSEVLFETATTN